MKTKTILNLKEGLVHPEHKGFTEIKSGKYGVEYIKEDEEREISLYFIYGDCLIYNLYVGGKKKSYCCFSEDFMKNLMKGEIWNNLLI